MASWLKSIFGEKQNSIKLDINIQTCFYRAGKCLLLVSLQGVLLRIWMDVYTLKTIPTH